MKPVEDRLVEVVFADADSSFAVQVAVPVGTTAAEALRLSGIVSRIPNPQELALSSHGRRLDPGHVLAPGERVEVSRPLRVDPREARRRRAAVQGARLANRRGSGPGRDR